MISNRLKAIGDLVPKGSVVCDIGCDHALLPVYLLEEGIASFAIAMDVGEGPLSSARANITEHGLLDKVELRLSDGFSALKPGECNCAVLAGMGGLLMKDILIRGKSVWESLDLLILSPHRDEAVIREYMGGFCEFSYDLFLKDGKEFYTIMCFLPKKPPIPLSRENILFGINPSREYLEYRLNLNKNILNSLNNAPKKRDIIEKENSIKAESLMISELMDRLV